MSDKPDPKPRTLKEIGADVAGLRSQTPIACHRLAEAAAALTGKASRKKAAAALGAAADLPGGHRDAARKLLAELVA